MLETCQDVVGEREGGAVSGSDRRSTGSSRTEIIPQPRLATFTCPSPSPSPSRGLDGTPICVHLEGSRIFGAAFCQALYLHSQRSGPPLHCLCLFPPKHRRYALLRSCSAPRVPRPRGVKTEDQSHLQILRRFIHKGTEILTVWQSTCTDDGI